METKVNRDNDVPREAVSAGSMIYAPKLSSHRNDPGNALSAKRTGQATIMLGSVLLQVLTSLEVEEVERVQVLTLHVLWLMRPMEWTAKKTVDERRIQLHTPKEARLEGFLEAALTQFDNTYGRTSVNRLADALQTSANLLQHRIPR